MQFNTYAIIVISTALAVSCNKKNAEIDQTKETAIEAIDNRKAEVNKDAKHATQQVEAMAKIDKANIQADNASIQAQLDADKKAAEAKAEAAKAGVDIEK